MSAPTELEPWGLGLTPSTPIREAVRVAIGKAWTHHKAGAAGLTDELTAWIEARIRDAAAAEDDAPWCACGRDVPEGQTLCTRCEMEAWHEEMELCDG